MAITGEQTPGQVSGGKRIRENPALRGPYPTDLLARYETALILFAAGFYGKNDGAWIADAGIKATCVDSDKTTLREMKRHYPKDWLFVHGDAFKWATDCPYQYDLLSIDPPMQYSMSCLVYLEQWEKLAKKTIVLGTQRSTIIDWDLNPAHPGWAVDEVMYRNEDSLWLVLQRKTV